LLLGLLAAPAAAAHRVTGRPFAGVLLAGAFAVGAMVAGLMLAYAVPWLPPSTAVIAVAMAIYGVSAIRP
jgi:zinc/manganese transport system permease protein